MGVAAFAVEQRAAELMLELLDGAGQRRLADVALLRRAREIQRVGKRNEIAHLLHFHRNGPLSESTFSYTGAAKPRHTDCVSNQCRLGL